jgi:hypothetical protein
MVLIPLEISLYGERNPCLYYAYKNPYGLNHYLCSLRIYLIETIFIFKNMLEGNKQSMEEKITYIIISVGLGVRQILRAIENILIQS